MVTNYSITCLYLFLPTQKFYEEMTLSLLFTTYMHVTLDSA